MDKVIRLLRRFGYEYRNIPKDYIRDQIRMTATGAEMGEAADPEYLRLLCGYLMCIGDKTDAEYMESFPFLLKDENNTRWISVLAEEKDRKEYVEEFEKMFSKYMSSYSSKDLLEVGFRKDPVSAALVILIGLSVLPSIIFFISMEANNSGDDSWIFGVLALTTLLCAILAFRLRSTVPAGFDNPRTNCLLWAMSFLNCTLCFILSVVISSLSSSWDRAGSVSVFLIMFPIAVFFITGGINILRNLKYRRTVSVDAVVNEHLNIVTGSPLSQNYKPVFAYEYEGVSYFSRVEGAGAETYGLNQIKKKYPIGKNVRIVIEKYNPSRIIVPKHDMGGAVMLIVIGAAIIAAAVVVLILNVE